MGLKQQILNIVSDKHVARVRITALALTDNADVYQSLLVAKDDPNYDLATDGTNVAECEVGSRLIGIDLNIKLYTIAQNDIEEVILYKDPDNLLSTGMTPSELFAADVTAQRIVVRKHAMWYNVFIGGGAGQNHQFFMRVSKGAMARNRKFADGDVLKLMFSQNDASISRKAYIVGRLIFAK